MSDITLSKAVRTNLLSLQNTADLMATTQNRLATGKKVNSALDNPTNFFTASSLNSRASDMNSLLDSMANGIQVLEAADNGISAITKTVESMQSTLRQARQDKSFQTQSFDVTSDSVLNISGGTLAEGINVSLPSGAPGEAAQVTSSAAYTGPAVGDSVAGGARTEITWHADMDGTNGEVTVDGIGLDLSDAAITDAATAATAIQSQLGDAYSVTEDTGVISIEKVDTSAAAPVVDLGDTGAVAHSVTFAYDPARMGGTIDIDGSSVDVSGASVEEFVAAAQDQLGGDYVVSNEGNEVTIARATPGAAGGAITFDALDATTSATDFNIDISAGGGGSFTIKGIDGNEDQEVTFAASATNTDVQADIEAAMTAAGYNTADYTVGVTAGGAVSIDADAAGDTPAVTLADEGTATGYTSVQGLAAVESTVIAGEDGAVAESFAAPTDTFSVTYGTATADVSVARGTEEEMAASINSQLAEAGIAATASFDADGNLSITANAEEGKTLAIAGDDASAIFGSNTVDIGKAAEAPLNATKTVDKFVELINRDYGTSIRASNDNGRLRIENLSTTDMSVGVDKDGDASVDTTSTIEGNSVRDSLAAQFNELKDQLDKLADDASFNGINLLRGDKLTITFNESGSSSIDIQTKDGDPITAGNLSIDSLSGSDLDSDANIDKLLSTLGTALNELRSQASSFGSNLSSVQNRQDFTKNMINTLETGAANLTLADSNEEAANLLALQTRQQLSSTALSMASQQDQAVLRLF